MMTVTKSLQRIGWRFSQATKNGNTFTINQNDIDAINSIAEYVEQAQSQQFEANHLFAKMYIYTYMKVLEQDGSTVLDNNARRKIGNLLNKPLTQIIEDFTRSLNDSEMYSLLEGAGSEFKHPAITSNDEKQSVIDNILQDKDNALDVISGVWDYETVKDSLIAEVNNAINTHG